MDQLTTILIALGTGATIKTSTTTTNENVKNKYQNLIELIRTKFKSKKIDDMVLIEYEVAPTIWRSELKEELSRAEVAEDPDIVRCAQELLERVEPERASDSKVVGTVQGYNQGSYQQVFMNVGRSPRVHEQKKVG
jgi:hypothetical protein